MGYTLVASLGDSFFRKMDELAAKTNANKIPFGRNCDREEANRQMRSHMTIAHWAKEKDDEYLPRVDQIEFSPFHITVTGTGVMYAEENSMLLYFSVRPGSGYQEAAEQIECALGIDTSDFLHITIAASKDHEFIRKLKEETDRQFRYPFDLDISGLDLYHIWKPVVLTKHIEAHV